MAHRFPDTWQLLPLEDCMDAIIDYRGKTPKKTSFGVPLVTAKVVKGGRILGTPREYIAFDNYDTWMRRGLPKPGDIVMTTEAPLGEIAQLDERKVALAQRLITLRGKSGLLDNDFLKQLMQSRFVQHQLQARSTGTTVLGIKQRELRKVTLVIPPLDEQKEIAHILGTLDDKIELNHRMNQTLEAIARAIFKSWFVDFDPVRAKLAGQQPPGLAPHIADLFPDAFEASELGEIPKGWKTLSVGDICEFAYGKSLKASLRKPGNVPVMGSNGQIGWHDTPLVKGPGVVVGRKGNPGIVTWVNSDFHPIDTTFYVVPCLAWVPLIYLHYALTGLNLPLLSADSAVPGLNRNIAYMSWLLLPSREVLDVFARHARLIMNRVYQGEQENRILTALRDTLLPKLISGELRVPIDPKGLQDL
jgi:type I restriction enzyme S subunit